MVHMTSLPPPLSERDAVVVRLVGRFRQLTSRHVACVLFADVTEMPVNRSLRRLLASGYLTPHLTCLRRRWRIPRVGVPARRRGWVFSERAGTFKRSYKSNWHAR